MQLQEIRFSFIDDSNVAQKRIFFILKNYILGNLFTLTPFLTKVHCIQLNFDKFRFFSFFLLNYCYLPYHKIVCRCRSNIKTVVHSINHTLDIKFKFQLSSKLLPKKFSRYAQIMLQPHSDLIVLLRNL